MFFSLPKLHIVHIKEKYNTLKEAINDTIGVAALAFFYEVKKNFGHLLSIVLFYCTCINICWFLICITEMYITSINYMISLFFNLGVHKRKSEIQSSNSGFGKNSI